MSRSLFWLSDEAWAVIEPHLPKNQPGARRVDDRRVISGIIHMLKRGGRWVDCPPEYGLSTTVYNRWSRRGIWTRILAALTEEGWIAETGQIDSSYIKARGGRVGLNRDRHSISGSSAGFIIELPIWGVMRGGRSPTGVTPHIGGQTHAAIAIGRLSKYAWSGVRAPRLECGLLAL